MRSRTRLKFSAIFRRMLGKLLIIAAPFGPIM